MSIFALHEAVLENYRQYVHSFMTIADERIRTYVEDQLTKKNTLWPEPLIQLNPGYDKSSAVKELRYILDPQEVYGPDFPGETFRVLKEKENRRFGEYRTRRLVLEA